MHFLELVDARTRRKLLDLGQTVELVPGAVLMRRGAMGGDIFMVRSGSLEVVDPRGQPALVLGLLGPGDMVGEMGFVDAAPRSADVRAREASRCLVWRRSALRRLLAEDTAVASSFWSATAEIAVQRIRTLTDTVRAGSLSRPLAPGAVDPSETSELAADLHAAWAHAERPVEGDPPTPDIIGASLDRLGATLSRVGDPDRADGMGAALAAAVADVLSEATTARLLLQRAAGTPPCARLVEHIRAGVADGRGHAGRALDAALLSMPTLRAQRHLPAMLVDALGDCAGPILVLSLAPATIASAFGRRAGAKPDQLILAQDDALALALGSAGLPDDLGAAVLDNVIEGLPDRLVVALTARLQRRLRPGGCLALAHARPSTDDALLDHLLRWPMLRRSPSTVAELLGAAGLRCAAQPSPAAAAPGAAAPSEAAPWAILRCTAESR